MAKGLDWDSRIGRRLRLRDLHVLFAVVEHGSMSAAGTHLSMSQSAVSQAIAALEDALKVRLLDRTARGVEPTIYADAIMRRGTIVFDELRSGIKDIEFLADPAGGEVRIACSDNLAGGILAPVIETFSKKYPQVVLKFCSRTPSSGASSWNCARARPTSRWRSCSDPWGTVCAKKT